MYYHKYIICECYIITVLFCIHFFTEVFYSRSSYAHSRDLYDRSLTKFKHNIITQNNRPGGVVAAGGGFNLFFPNTFSRTSSSARPLLLYYYTATTMGRPPPVHTSERGEFQIMYIIRLLLILPILMKCSRMIKKIHY